MPAYQLRFLAPDNTPLGSEFIDCDDDGVAFQHAQQLVNGNAVELWEGARFLATIECDASREQRQAAEVLPTSRAPFDRHEWIRQRAFELWYLQGSPEGRDKEHWEQASREVDGEAASAGSRDR